MNMDSVNIILAHQPQYDKFDKRRAQPLGIAYVAASLRCAGFSLLIIDFLDRRPNRAVQRILPFLRETGRNIVGFSVYSETFPNILKTTQLLKEVRPDCFILLGGPHASVAHRYIIQNYPWIDAVIRGEGEDTVVEVVARVADRASLSGVAGVTWQVGDASGQSDVYIEQPRALRRDLDSLPIPARDLLPSPRRYSRFWDSEHGRQQVMASVLSSRGCPYRCTFCMVPILANSNVAPPEDNQTSKQSHLRWRSRSVESTVNEIFEVCAVKDWGVEHIYFVDDNFFVNPDRCLEILDKVKSKLDITFSFTARSDQIVRYSKLLSPLKQAGCVAIEVGIESGTVEELGLFGKGITPDINIEAIRLLQDASIHVMPDFIMFHPWSNIRTIAQNLDFLAKAGLWGRFPPPIVNKLTLYPGTALTEKAQQEAIVSKSVNLPCCIPDYHIIDPDADALYSTFMELMDDFLLDIRRIVTYGNTYRLKNNVKANDIRLAQAFVKTLPYSLLKKLIQAVKNGQDPSAVATSLRPHIINIIEEAMHSMHPD